MPPIPPAAGTRRTMLPPGPMRPRPPLRPIVASGLVSGASGVSRDRTAPSEGAIAPGMTERAAAVAIEQFEGTSVVCGQSVDKNWLYFTEEGEDMELRARVERLERLIGGNGVDDGEGKRLTGEAALAWMDGRGLSLLLGLANAQAAIAGASKGGPHEHIATVEVRLI